MRFEPRRELGKARDLGAPVQLADQRGQGLDIAANVYPYIASGTGLSTLAPDWALEGAKTLAEAGR